MPRRMFQTDRMLDAMMPVPIVAMKIDTIDQISPLSLLNQISNSIMQQNPLLPLSESPILAFLSYFYVMDSFFNSYRARADKLRFINKAAFILQF